MNKIKKLFDAQYAKDLLSRKILPHYPEYKRFSRVEVKPHKDLVWEETYHVVIEFEAHLERREGGEEVWKIFCSAHSSEGRENAYLALKYLWDNGLSQKNIDLPTPLFYSEYFNGAFYRGLEGENLLYYIKRKDALAVKRLVLAAADLYAALHALPAEPEADFNPINARIKTVIPGTETIFREMAARYNGRYDTDLKAIYSYFISEEEKFFSRAKNLFFIHGDAHPENIICTGEQRIGLIDFTDFCRGDLARDLGSFQQQLEYKIGTKIRDQEYATKMKSLFLGRYLEKSGRELTPELEKRIDLYYNWTAMRTATFFFLRHEADPKRGEDLIQSIKNNLSLNR